MRKADHRTSGHGAVLVSSRPLVPRDKFSGAMRAQPRLCTTTSYCTPSRARARESVSESSEDAMANPSPILNPNPPKFVTGAQIKGARALLGWRRVDLAKAAGLHRNAVAYWEGQQRMPRSEPFACQKMRAALLSAGVVTVSTPAPGVCLLPSKGPRPKPALGLSSLVPNSEGGGHRFLTAENGPQLCKEHSDVTVSTEQEQRDRSPPLAYAPSTSTSEGGA